MKILCLDNWGEKARKILEDVAEVHYRVKNIVKYDGFITRLQPTDLRFYELGNLKFIASCTTGLDHIDLDYCKENGIKIISLQGERDFLQDVWATAEHTWALILSLIRRVPFAFDDVKQGNWNREAWQGMELHGKTLGIVGYGRVGQQVAKMAEAFGMRVIHIDKDSLIPYEDYLRHLLRASDIITVHVPLSEETQHMFSEREFEMMKPTAYFINTSRGAVVDEGALIEALATKKIKGAATDFANEWLIKYAAMNDNLIITPHLGGNTTESREKTQVFIANKIKEFVNGIR